MKIIEGLIMAARLANKDITYRLETDYAEFKIGDITLDIYVKDENIVMVTPTCENMWGQPLYVEGTVGSVFSDILDMVNESDVDCENSPYRQRFSDLKSLVKYIEKETGVIAGEHPKCYIEECADVIEFEEFKVVLFGPYHGTVYAPEDYQLNFVLDELP